MIRLRQLGRLSIAAASGIARVGPVLYVAADDELFLDGYDDAARLVSRTALLPGELDPGAVERKRTKPDFEAIVALPGGRLLLLPSGSSAARSTAVIVRPGHDPVAARAIDAAPLHAALRDTFPDLNLEGAAVIGDRMRLLQRGNAARIDNAVIDLALAPLLRRIDDGGPLDDDLLVAIRSVDLGSLDGVPLGFTDAAPLEPGGTVLAFVAAAEATRNAVDDGACAGSILGLLDESGGVTWQERIEGAHKIEGLDADRERGLRMVADADDRAQRAPLFHADWPW